MPKKSREAIRNISKLDEFERKWYKDNANKNLYNIYYSEWPTELFSNAVPKAVMRKAQDLGRRLTMDEYLEIAGPIAERLLPHTKQLEKHIIEQQKNQTIYTEWKKLAHLSPK
jgi:hypothetical protein